MRIGVDVGGTFTDIVVYDEATGEVTVRKRLTDIADPAGTVVQGTLDACPDLARVDILVHATTLGTNALFGQAGLELPRTALITTRGFRDVLEIARQNRPELYNLFFERPRPLVRRRDRYEVDERIDSAGRVVKPLDRSEARRLAGTLRKRSYESIAICLINSYANPTHEAELKRIVADECKEAFVIASHEVDPHIGEYERMSTTVVNAILQPIFTVYLRKLAEELRRRGFRGSLLVMHSGGGVVDAAYACERPAMLIESGPAAGAVAAAHYSRLIGDQQVISFDMGGTTAKVAAIIDWRPMLTDEYEVGGAVHRGRVVKGSGYPVRGSFVDLVEVGAGGGTVGWVDRGGAIRVGPMSVGARPGPACYGMGGEKATITDANLVLGRLGEALAGGEIRLVKEEALKAVGRVADEAGLDAVEAASRIIEVANSLMADAIRIATVERGLDPSAMTMYAFGGAGPLHAAEIAAEVGVEKVVVPPHSGVFSALGLLLSDIVAEESASCLMPASEVEDEDVEVRIRELSGRLLERYPPASRGRIEAILEMRFRGQEERISVAWRGSVEKAVRDFTSRYRRLYGYIPDAEVEIASIKVLGWVSTAKPVLRRFGCERHVPRPRERREVYFGDWVEARVYHRGALRPGALLEGPALIEAYDTTILLPPGCMAEVDGYLNIVIEVSGDG